MLWVAVVVVDAENDVVVSLTDVDKNINDKKEEEAKW